MSFDGPSNGLLLETVESQSFPCFFQPIELPPDVFLQHIEPIQQASQIINFLRSRLKGHPLLCHQSIPGQQVSINDIILAEYADTFSELPDTPWSDRANQHRTGKAGETIDFPDTK